MSGDIFLCHKWGGATARDAVQHPTVHRTAPTTKNDLTPNVNSAKVENPCPRITSVVAVGPSGFSIRFWFFAFAPTLCVCPPVANAILDV